MSSDFWVITCYFNPARYETKRRNFDAFMAGMRKPGPTSCVVEICVRRRPVRTGPGRECASAAGHGRDVAEGAAAEYRGRAPPASARKIGWFDADIIFKEPDWLERTSQSLDRSMVVQPFSHAVRLHRDNRDDGTGVLDKSFASMFVREPRWPHASVQVSWSYRLRLGRAPRVVRAMRSVRACLTGSGDHLMAHAFAAGMMKSPCMRHTFFGSPEYAEHFLPLGDSARDVVKAKMRGRPRRILHLWHGDLADRRYADRERAFRRLGLDPKKHLRLDANGLWEWSEEAPASLRAWADGSFHHRNEDGKLTVGDRCSRALSMAR